jgi:hypothetical protein
MPRRRRVHLDWVPVHIVQRGHNRGACFFDDQDRYAYLGRLHEALRREGCRLRAYVLMTKKQEPPEQRLGNKRQQEFPISKKSAEMRARPLFAR